MKTKIGLIDSGVGGFSLLKELLNRQLGVHYYYLPDRPGTRYGPMTSDEVFARLCQLVEILIAQKIDFIVLACNTATAVAIAPLRLQYPQITFVGIEPYVNAINHQVLTNPAILVTKLTSESSRFKDLLLRYDPQNRMKIIPCPQLAALIENYYGKELDQAFFFTLDQDLGELGASSIKEAVLGCTHYPLIAEVIENRYSVRTINPAGAVASRVKSLLNLESEANLGDDLSYYHHDCAAFKPMDPSAPFNWPSL